MNKTYTHEGSMFLNRKCRTLLLTLYFLLAGNITSLFAQWIETDRTDYWPGATAYIVGGGFQPGETILLDVAKANGDPWFNPCTSNWTVTADAGGEFSSTWYVCMESLNLTLIATAQGAISGSIANVTFTDGAADLDQARNGSAASPNNPILWVNGNAGASNSHYVEGYSVPYRIVITGLTAGTHVLEIEWDTKHSGANAIDFITSYDRLEPHITQFGHGSEDIDPLFGTGLVAPSFVQSPVPAPIVNTTAGTVGGLLQPLTAFNSLPLSERQMTMYNGLSIVSMIYISDGSDPAGGDLSQTQSACRLQITFTTSNAMVVFAWGGHIGRGADWGPGNSAGGISGSPYHTRLINLDGSGGNQDRSLSASAVAPPSCAITGNLTSCTGSVVTFTGPAGNGYTYQWALINNTSNATFASGTTSQSVSVNAGTVAGSFGIQITVSDGFGSGSTCDKTVTVTGLNVTANGTINASCNGSSNGSTTVSATGGTPPYTGVGLKSGLAAGTYTYTVTDANNCSGSVTVTITEPPVLQAAASVTTNVSCNGGNNGSATVTASGGTPPYSGDGLKSNLAVGTYTYTVTDDNGCTATATVTITEPPVLQASGVVNSNIDCFGGNNGSATITATGGTPPYSGDGLKSGLAAGTYTYTVTDDNGCTATATVTITEPPLLQASAMVNSNVSCNGGNDGSATVTATGGTPPYSGDGLKSGLTAGTYTYTVTDANGCTATATITITEPPVLIASNIVNSNATCNGNNTGSATVSATGGTPPYSGDGLKSGLAAGTYTYTVTDANGCTASTTVTITEPSGLLASSIVNTNVSCNGGNNGSATVSATGGTPPYSGDGLKSGLAAGTYSYTVTDANGCTSSTSVTITEPPVLQASAIVNSNVSCNGGNNGSATVTATGGTPPYSGDGLKSGLTAGTYTYTVTDDNGCIATATVTITEPPLLQASAMVNSNVSCNGGNDGSATVTATGGTPPYSGDGLKSGLTAGTYTYTVTDANGCTATATVTITEPPVLIASNIVNSNATCNGNNSGSATVSATGGTPPYSGDGLKSGLAAGTYTYTVTDANGCTASTTVTITEPSGLLASSIVNTNVSCNGGNNGSATVSGTGGTPPYSGDGLKSGLAAGTYTYTVTDANGCTSSTSVTITEPPVLQASAIVNSNVSCNDGENGSATVTATGGTPPYSGDGLKSGLAAGTYTYTVTDDNGCTATATVTITEPTSLSATASVNTNVSCNGGSNGSANVTANGGTPPYSGTGLKTGLSAGTYTYTVTDANGCTAMAMVTITEPPVLMVTCSTSGVTISSNPSGGSGSYSYQWSPGGFTTQNITVSASGNYTVVVTDANSCTATSSCSAVVNCQGFRTQTQGGWGAPPRGNNPAKYMTRNFAGVFTAPNYLTVGCSTGNKLRLTTAQAVTDFLPSGSTARALPAGTLVNPGGSYRNVLAGQVVALTLSVRFDLADPNFSPATTHLEDLLVASGTFSGWSVGQVLAEANKKLGGCASPYSFSTLNNVVSKINENFVDGKTDSHFLVCPGQVARVTTSEQTEMFEDENLTITTYPNPFTSTVNIEFMKLDSDSRVELKIYDLTGHLISELFDGEVISGNNYSVTFDGTDLPNGIYIYRLISNNNLHSGRLILMK